ncbi:MAG: NYN domain-containing protein [candidate division Zixibacteria bacterium]|nr:NYN domain-containing protein [candidate division Zixibacteria bacterium]MBU1472064.1 NYN domain-containing protein [candidate division Zixibacteria bacterium]MBU2623942.1 NYN domain-containing protein [candidate division Zixibacteria bacterium]
MAERRTGKLIRIGIFYDGSYFFKVSNFYKFGHRRKARLSFDGIHAFVRAKVAELEDVEEQYCHIIEAHYFRGRLSAQTASATDQLEKERIFDDVLIKTGILTHYLPLDETNYPRPVEKGVDVLLSVESLDLAYHRQFDVVVLVACDGDYVSLVKKLNGMGARVMLLGWDFSYEFDTESGSRRREQTRVSQSLINAVTYPMMLSRLIDDRTAQRDSLINGLFVG